MREGASVGDARESESTSLLRAPAKSVAEALEMSVSTSDLESTRAMSVPDGDETSANISATSLARPHNALPLFVRAPDVISMADDVDASDSATAQAVQQAVRSEDASNDHGLDHFLSKLRQRD